MFESSQNWELFGYDMRNLGRHFLAAWRDFLWAHDSPIRQSLDEAVVLQSPEGKSTYHAGRPGHGANARCTAVLLPAELALSRVITLPVEVESDLQDVIALEVNANSPFTADDTGFGWRIIARTEQRFELLLVIVSMSSAMTYVGQQYGSHDAHAQEVWVDIDGQLVVLQGFGEGERDRLYQKRLLRVAATVTAGAVLLLLMAVIGVGLKKVELGQLESLAAATQQESAPAARMRSVLSQANEMITEVNQMRAGYPPVYFELARLTELLGDDAYLERFGMTGLELDLRGRARDAAAVMELLTEQEEYAEVMAASPIRSIAGSDAEQFHLKIKMRGADT